MKVAFIGPPQYLQYMIDTKYHLMLPWTARHYVDFKGFKILDNGAAEGQLVEDPDKLHALAMTHQANEIVIPDVIGNVTETVQLARNWRQHAEPWNYNYMAVLQGQQQGHLVRCLQAYERMEYVTTIGVPKHLQRTLRDKFVRYRFVEWMDKQGYLERFDVHFLGATDWVREVSILSELGARGIDTSVPVLAGMAKEDIRHLPKRLERPDGYFNLEPDMETMSWITSNMKQYMDWAEGY